MIKIEDIEEMINKNNEVIAIIMQDNLHLEAIKKRIEGMPDYERKN